MNKVGVLVYNPFLKGKYNALFVQGILKEELRVLVSCRVVDGVVVRLIVLLVLWKLVGMVGID